MKNQDKYILYLQIINLMGKGIMILAQVWEVVNHYKVTNKATFYRHINKMIELNLLKSIEVEKVKVVYFTQASADLLGLNKTISTSKVANTRTLNQSMIKSQYVINFMLQRYSNLDDFLTKIVRCTNLVSSNALLFRALKEDYGSIWANSADGINFDKELEYHEYAYARKIAQLNGTTDKLSDVKKPRYTAENMVNRSIYVTGVKAKESTINIQFTLLESDSKLVTADNFALDMEMLKKWMFTFPSDKVKVQIVVKQHRVKAIELMIRKYKLKNSGCDFIFEIVGMESALNTYFNTSAIFLELNDSNTSKERKRKTSTIEEVLEKEVTD